jgi:hypothetical protein
MGDISGMYERVAEQKINSGCEEMQCGGARETCPGTPSSPPTGSGE